MSRTETFEVQVPLPTAGSWQMNSSLRQMRGDGQASLPENRGMINNAEYLAKAFARYCSALFWGKLLKEASLVKHKYVSPESFLLSEYESHFYKEITVTVDILSAGRIYLL